MTKSALEYSKELLNHIVELAEARKATVVSQAISGPFPSKTHKDKRLCVVVDVRIEYPDGSSSKITCEQPVDVDYSNKEDFFVENLLNLTIKEKL